LTKLLINNNTERACIKIHDAYNASGVQFNRNSTTCLNSAKINGTFWDTTIDLWTNDSAILPISAFGASEYIELQWH